MRTVLLSCLIGAVVLSAPPAHAGEEIDWSITNPESGTVVGNEVRVAGPGTHHLTTVDAPGIGGDSYAVTGSVRYEGVASDAYLEMWSYFADGGSYYSRTLATEGPMAALSGDSDGRVFELPFALNGSEGPERIEINVVLPAAGTVWIGPLELVGFGPSSEWWSVRQGGMVGAIGGTLVGLSGAVLGILAGRRRSRRLVVGTLVGGVVVGIVLLALSLAALGNGQPRHVWYPPLLLGLILTVGDGLLIPTVRRGYAAAEMRRMQAFDA